LTQNRARTVFLLAHTGRPAAIRSAELVVKGLLRSGIGVRVLEHEARDLPLSNEVELVKEATPQCLDGCELLIVLGGDGTLLRGAEFARASGVPMLGVNLGRVGFLAEAERDDLDKVVDRVVTKSYEVEERMTVDVVVHQNGNIVHTDRVDRVCVLGGWAGCVARGRGVVDGADQRACVVCEAVGDLAGFCAGG
jgi:NAD+ kinase